MKTTNRLVGKLPVLAEGYSGRKQGRFYTTESGTRSVKEKEKALPVRLKAEPVSERLKPFMGGEAEGDLMLAILLAVRNLIQDVKRYSRNHRALNGQGQTSEPTSPTSVRWSVHGAVEIMTHEIGGRSLRQEVLDAVKRCMPKDGKDQALFRWLELDSTTHGRVVNLLNMAVGVRKKELGHL